METLVTASVGVGIPQCMEEIQVRDLQIMDGKKHVEEVETRLKMQQNLYEAVHADRNNYR